MKVLLVMRQPYAPVIYFILAEAPSTFLVCNHALCCFLCFFGSVERLKIYIHIRNKWNHVSMCSTVADRFKPVSSVSLLVMFFYHFLIFVPILLLSLFLARFLSLCFSSQILLSFSRRHLGYIRLVFRVCWLQTEKENRVMCIYIFPTDLIFQPHKHLTGYTNLFKFYLQINAIILTYLRSQSCFRLDLLPFSSSFHLILKA